MESEEREGCTLVQVISEKYNPDNFPYCRGPGVGVVIRSSPQGSPVKDRLNLPRILVLDGCGITEAGDEEEVATCCAHVVELDLSHNQLKDWGEISKILFNIPNLDFLNLSMNPLRGSSLDPGAAEAFSGLRRLVLNNTHVTWDIVHTLTREIPELEELFLCLNEYESVSTSSVPYPSLRLLHITDNQLQEWAEVRKLGLMYPGLVSLILANNSLSAIHEPEDSLQRLFPNLRSINLHNSGLSRWEDIEKLNFFPRLQEVRLLGIPLLQPYTDQERRCLMVAQLPGVTALNGSIITEVEREDAERFFIRYYLDCPEDELPQRYHNLVARYGRLAPLAEVDLRPLCSAQVEVRFGDQTEPLELRLDQTVADLKKQLRAVIQLPPNKMRVYYIDRQLGYALEPQEMKYGARALHSYSIRDGDEIMVVPKTQ
ncbi:tubulin-specific chaperone cofactor E-like protein [Myxocyprinus asiaticus]|uniref:tubulin-specific chaperone cofactor E-like protein n=1 Tax=Myxocyprinus asiaticus TaxID=70543 RepID=UPI002222D8BC|nr:tubulin-specific chaperone cofactor E-like protein [Myxocyprinus asiaticus]XP_051525158.1 tubulin-specific chaperone cofactor E-like protein [Myxocyprinus asiaticus]XP_051525165.1 tubulin-specific chaperone cofactor E-like protein [Myxocyprinus asiaticus]